MEELLSPAQVARAINVSESSVKRWCDCGQMKTQRTPGGHRRILASEVIRYLREIGHVLADPTVLGLPAKVCRSKRSIDRVCDDFHHLLEAGSQDAAQALLLELFLSDYSLAMIGDTVLSPAFQRIGMDWARGKLDVYQERRACEITHRTLHEIRRLLPVPSVEAPLAMGGTFEPDFSVLPTLLVELVLRQAGWRTIQLGCSLPCDSMVAAISEKCPDLVWLSASHIEDEQRFIQQFRAVSGVIGRCGALAVGGNALNESLRQQLSYTVFCDRLKDLEAFAATFAEAIAKK